MLDFGTLAKPVVGALIGYSTNWLAIKMLFKPHEAKYIGKFRIPFTPGLIPKERERIARSLGTAVGENLLTEEVISKELLDETVIEHIKTYVIKGLLEKDLSAEVIMKKVLGDEYDMVVGKVVKSVESYIRGYIDGEGFDKQVESKVKTYLKKQYPHDTILTAVMPSQAYSEIEGMIYKHKDQISQFIVDESKSEAVVAKLKVVVGELLLEKVGALGAMFVNPDDIAVSILSYIEKTLFEEEVQTTLISGLMKGVERSSGMALSELVSERQYDDLIASSSAYVANSTSVIIGSVDFEGVILTSVNYFLKKPLHLSQNEKEKIEYQVEALYCDFIKRNIGTFLETFELKNIVETEVNAFSVTEIEKLIFTIVDKELNAITWFGALLGFIMGIAMILIP